MTNLDRKLYPSNNNNTLFNTNQAILFITDLMENLENQINLSK